MYNACYFYLQYLSRKTYCDDIHLINRESNTLPIHALAGSSNSTTTALI